MTPRIHLPSTVLTRHGHDPAWRVTLDNLPLLGPLDHENGQRFEITHYPGPWSTIRSVTGLAVLDIGYAPSTGSPYPSPNRRLIVGRRTLTDCRESGYDLVGRVSIAGVKHRAFTSDMLVSLPDGALGKIAILYCCSPVRPTQPLDLVTEA